MWRSHKFHPVSPVAREFPALLVHQSPSLGGTWVCMVVPAHSAAMVDKDDARCALQRCPARILIGPARGPIAVCPRSQAPVNYAPPPLFLAVAKKSVVDWGEDK